MVIKAFPPVESADRSGLLAVGGDLEVESLLLAYRSGIFPWPLDARHLTWFAPPRRTILFLKDVHFSKSLRKSLKGNNFTFKIDSDFGEIISACAELGNRKGQEGTWITRQLQKAYAALHQAGYCHCVGCYESGCLIGGLYGVSIGGMFAGESMFYRKTNASKLALVFLIEFLKDQKVPWIDCQVTTPLLRSFGAVSVKRTIFMEMLAAAIDKEPLSFS